MEANIGCFPTCIPAGKSSTSSCGGSWHYLPSQWGWKLSWPTAAAQREAFHTGWLSVQCRWVGWLGKDRDVALGCPYHFPWTTETARMSPGPSRSNREIHIWEAGLWGWASGHGNWMTTKLVWDLPLPQSLIIWDFILDHQMTGRGAPPTTLEPVYLVPFSCSMALDNLRY